MLLAAGMAMIVAGYVGCFSLVSHSEENGPYVWLGMEITLSLLRICLWGWNPTWDDHSTGMKMRLELHDSDKNLGCDVPSDDEPLFLSLTNEIDVLEGVIEDTRDSLFPLITTPHHLSRLSSFWLRDDIMWKWRKDQRESFIVESAEDFLATATSFVGPLRRLEIESTSLFYSIVPYVDNVGEARKLLWTTALYIGSNKSISIFTGGSKIPHNVFSSNCDDLPVEVLDSRTFTMILEHSYDLFSRLFGCNMYSDLDLLWTVTFPIHITTDQPECFAPLTRFDKEYMRLCQTYDLKGDYCSQRGNLVFSQLPAGSLRYITMVEYGVLMESAVLEIYLCCIEHDYTRTRGFLPAMSRRLILEWIRKMQARIAVERRQCKTRSSNLPAEALETWDSLAIELRSLRFLPPRNVIELFELQLFSNMRYLENALLPLFTKYEGTTGTPETPIYHNMVTYLRSSLQLPQNSHPTSLFDRINVHGPASTWFSPSHMSIHKVTKDVIKEMFSILNSNLQPPTALSTLSFRDIQEALREVDNPFIGLISSILKKNENIIFIQKNREKWKRNANRQDELMYRAGLQFTPSEEEGNTHVLTTGDVCFIWKQDVYLKEGAEIYMLVYIPACGKIVPVISLVLDDVDVDVTAKLRRSTVHDIFDVEVEIPEIETEVSVSSGQRTLELDGFTDVEEGCYELRIGIKEGWYLSKKVVVEFIPGTGKSACYTQLGILEAEERMMSLPHQPQAPRTIRKSKGMRDDI
ncbi:hypothetical protein L218DRAFT_995151 [Marasmius fiardii PR-910]|nr:hypothetical protein L218DRAFT_995151 [Marasmius fiardii PR-910]